MAYGMGFQHSRTLNFSQARIRSRFLSVCGMKRETMELVTFHVNSYNRLPFLQNLLWSFEACNLYPEVEWVITDF